MDQLPETIACPYCGNVNPFTQENCMKCKKTLEPIRQAMGYEINVIDKANTPAPPVPVLQDRPIPIDKKNSEALKFIVKDSFLIRGMGRRLDDVVAFFYKQLTERNFTEFNFSKGNISLSTEGNVEDSRPFYFAERHLGEGALSIMAVRFALSGSDLYVEWRNYALPSIRQKEKFNFGKLALWYVAGVGIGAFVYGFNLLTQKDRKENLEGFQSQDNQAFQLSVRAALEEAIDHAGISKSLIQEVSNEGNKDQRVI